MKILFKKDYNMNGNTLICDGSFIIAEVKKNAQVNGG